MSTLEVLLVEDSPGDVRLTREAFREANMSVRLHVAIAFPVSPGLTYLVAPER